MRFDAVLFDFGGTLDGPGDHWLARFRRTYGRMGLRVDPHRLEAAFAHATRMSYADPATRQRDLQATVAQHVAWQFDDLGLTSHELARSITADFVDQTRTHLDASRKLLQGWRTRTRLAVVSNFYGNVHILLGEAGITPLLDAIVDSTIVGVVKPDPRIFAIALERVGCAAERALFVGDSLDKDIAGARAAGLSAAWLPGPSELALGALSADFIFGSLAEIDEILV